MVHDRIGYFGGTFDPPHLGHLALASEAIHQFQLSRLYWGLTPDPPHKQDQVITPVQHRLKMLELMTAEHPLFKISFLEMTRPGPHYTIDTIHELGMQEQGAGVVLLLGDDSLLDLPSWRLHTELVTAVSRIGVMRRFGSETDYSALYWQIPGLAEKVQFIDAMVQPVSSREIRQRVMDGRVYRCYTLPSIANYMEENKLYLRN